MNRDTDKPKGFKANPLEIAHLAVELLPYTADEVGSHDANKKLIRVPSEFHHRAEEAVRMAHQMIGHAMAYEEDDALRKTPHHPYSTQEDKDEADEADYESFAILEALKKTARGRTLVECGEFRNAILHDQRHKPGVHSFNACWAEYEKLVGQKLPFSEETAYVHALAFRQWYAENGTRILGRLSKQAAARGGARKHRSDAEQHGQPILTKTDSQNIDDAAKGRVGER